MQFAFCASRVVRIFITFACLASVDFCPAEDWTVKEKVYHNVAILEVRPDIVIVTYDGGTGRPWFSISDLSPELQKRFKYDPVKAQEYAKVNASREIALRLAEIRMFSGGGTKERYDENQKERPAVVAELEKHPLIFVGTVMYGDGVLYAAEAEPNGSTVLDGKGGRCCLLSKKFFKEGEKVTLNVYQTHSASIDGKAYACFADDAGLAYDAAHP